MLNVLRPFLFFGALLFISQAQSHTGDDDKIAAVNRHSLMMVMGWGIKPLADMYSGKLSFDSEIATLQAKRLVQLAEMIDDIFSRNTSGKNISTSTLDKVWETPEDFHSRSQDLVDAAINYKSAILEGEDSAKRAFKQLADSCKSCHESYKSD